MYHVKKRDGKAQGFDRGKVKGSVIKAGGTEELAADVANEVEAWLPTVAVDNTVPSLEIRDKVLDTLEELDPEVAETFRSYTK